MGEKQPGTMYCSWKTAQSDWESSCAITGPLDSIPAGCDPLSPPDLQPERDRPPVKRGEAFCSAESRRRQGARDCSKRDRWSRGRRRQKTCGECAPHDPRAWPARFGGHAVDSCRRTQREGVAPSGEERGRPNANHDTECAASPAGTWGRIRRRRGRMEAAAKQFSGCHEAGDAELSAGTECARPEELGRRPHEGSIPRLTRPRSSQGPVSPCHSLVSAAPSRHVNLRSAEWIRRPWPVNQGARGPYVQALTAGPCSVVGGSQGMDTEGEKEEVTRKQKKQ